MSQMDALVFLAMQGANCTSQDEMDSEHSDTPETLQLWKADKISENTMRFESLEQTVDKDRGSKTRLI